MLSACAPKPTGPGWAPLTTAFFAGSVSGLLPLKQLTTSYGGLFATSTGLYEWIFEGIKRRRLKKYGPLGEQLRGVWVAWKGDSLKKAVILSTVLR